MNHFFLNPLGSTYDRLYRHHKGIGHVIYGIPVTIILRFVF